MRVKNIANRIIGCNLVLYQVKAPRGTNAWWKVKCIYCKREKDEMGSRLHLPGYNSCRCRTSIPKGTKYEVIGQIAVFTDSNGEEFIVDGDIAPLIATFTWYVRTTSSKMKYVWCSQLNKSLHRFILNPPKDMIVDHRNHNTLDNRRSNIWVCTQSDNMYNQYRFHK